MVATRSAGGPYGRGPFRLTWRGGRVLEEIRAQVEDGLKAEAREIEDDLHSTLHRVTGEMADEAFADVEVRSGRRVIAAGSNAEHTLYHELGTPTFGGHPQIRQIIDRHAPHVTQAIAAARKGSR